MEETAYERFLERYKGGPVPWDDELPPPELIALIEDTVPGRALDLGCGYGRAAIYLARRGWEVDGIDFIPQAVAEAKRRARKAQVADTTCFHTASVIELEFLSPPYQLAVDVGCMHALDAEQRSKYRDGLLRLLGAQAHFLLFVRVQGENPAEEGPRGILEADVEQLFQEGFSLVKREIGVTGVEDKSWRSGWFWFERD